MEQPPLTHCWRITDVDANVFPPNPDQSHRRMDMQVVMNAHTHLTVVLTENMDYLGKPVTFSLVPVKRLVPGNCSFPAPLLSQLQAPNEPSQKQPYADTHTEAPSGIPQMRMLQQKSPISQENRARVPAWLCCSVVLHCSKIHIT